MKRLLFLILLALPLSAGLISAASAGVNEYDRQGDSCLTDNKYHEAIDYYWLSLRFDPVQPYPYSRLAVCYKAIGMREEADLMIRQSQALENHQKWIITGDEQFGQSKFVEAIASYEKALGFFGDSYVACEKLAQIYERIGQKEKSHEMYKRSHELLMARQSKLDIENISSAAPDTAAIEKLRKEWEFTREEEILRRKLKEDSGYVTLLSAPLHTSNNNTFNALVYVPSLETAKIIPYHSTYMTISVDIASGKFIELSDWQVHYDQKIIEPSVTVAYGMLEKMELRFTTTMPSMQDNSNFGIILDQGGTYYVADNERGWGVGDFIPSVKYLIWESADGESTISVAGALKFPLADPSNFVSSGGLDMSVNFLSTWKMNESFLHFCLGYTKTGEPTVFEYKLPADGVMSFGAAWSIMMTDEFSMVAQFQGNTNAFSEIGGYSGMPMTFLAGGKFHAEYFMVDFGFGIGLGDQSSNFTGMMGFTTRF